MNTPPDCRAQGRIAHLRGALYAAAMFLVLGCVAPAARAAAGDLVTTYSLAGHSFALDPTRSRVYVSLNAANAVAVIDTTTLSLIGTVLVGSAPRGLAVSPDGSRVYVATSGASSLAVLDAQTLSSLPSLPLPAQPSDVEYGANDRLYVTPATNNSIGIMIVDALTGADLGTFSGGVFIYNSGLVEVSPDRNTLYFGNRGLSPGTVAKYDISVQPPVLLYKNPHGDLGSDGNDLALSADGQYLSYPSGGGNGPGYTIYKLRTSDFSVAGEFVTGAYPRELAYSPDGSTAFAVHTAGVIDVFDANTFVPLPAFPTSGEARELVVGQDGAYLFAAFDNELRVFETGLVGAVLPCDARLDATTYTDGELISLEIALSNNAPAAVATEWKVWLRMPGGTPLGLVNAGANGQLVLPPSFNFEIGPVALFAVTPAMTRGTGEIGCRRLDPVTGAMSFERVHTFELQ